MKTIIAKKTAAQTDTEGYYKVTAEDAQSGVCCVVAIGDLGSDTIPIVYVGHDGTTTQAYDDDQTTTLALSQGRPCIPLSLGVQIRAVKGATTNEVGVEIQNGKW